MPIKPPTVFAQPANRGQSHTENIPWTVGAKQLSDQMMAAFQMIYGMKAQQQQAEDRKARLGLAERGVELQEQAALRGVENEQWDRSKDIADADRAERGLDIRKGSLVPGDIRTFREFQQMTPEEQETFIQLQREKAIAKQAPAIPRHQFVGTDANGKPILLDPVGGKFVYPGGADAPSPVEEGTQVMPKTKAMPAGEVKAFGTFKSLRPMVDEIIATAKENPNFTGPIQGRYHKMKSVLFDDPKFVRFENKVKKLIETAYALSGKQISAAELLMLEDRFFSSVKTPDANFMESMVGLADWLANKENIVLDQYQSAGYKIPGESQSTEPGKRPPPVF